MNTTYFLNLIAGNLYGTKTTPAIPTKYYLGLSKTEPTVDGLNVTEPQTSANYSRVELKDLSEPSAGVITNTTQIEFEESTASWGTVTHFVVYDAETVGSGNLLCYGELSTPRSIEADTIMSVKTGYLKLSAKNPV